MTTPVSSYQEDIRIAHPELLPVLLKGGNLLHIPTNYGWTEGVTGSGGTVQGLTSLDTYTGATASSTARLYGMIEGINPGHWLNRVNWDKKLYIIISLNRYNAESEATGRIQLKAVSTIGALADNGVGIRIDNLALMGESYGTALGVVDLGTNLSDNQQTQIVIVHYPASKIEWYVNGVLKGTQSTANNIPSGYDFSYFMLSIINGATGGVDGHLMLFHPKIWQEA